MPGLCNDGRLLFLSTKHIKSSYGRGGVAALNQGVSVESGQGGRRVDIRNILPLRRVDLEDRISGRAAGGYSHH